MLTIEIEGNKRPASTHSRSPSLLSLLNAVRGFTELRMKMRRGCEYRRVDFLRVPGVARSALVAYFSYSPRGSNRPA